MSDSDEEAAFASADEGEESKGKTQEAKKTGKLHEESSPSAEQKQKEGVGTAGSGDIKGNKTPAAAGGKAAGKKGSERLKQGNKNKGKPGSQPSKENVKQSSDPPGGDGLSAKGSRKEPPKAAKQQASPTKEPSAKKESKKERPEKDSTECKSPAQSADGDKPLHPTKEKLSSKEKTSDEVTKQGPMLLDAQQATPAAKETKTAGEVRKGLVSDPEVQEIRAEQRDHHTPQQEEVLKKLEESAAEKTQGGGWGWGGWGSSLLSAATNSVQTFTSQVGDGISTIMETMETSLGVPDPTQLATANDVTETKPVDGGDEPVTTQPEEVKELEKPVKADSKSEDTKQASGGKESTEGGEKTETPTDQSGSSSDNWFSSWGVADLARKVQDKGKSLASKGQSLMSEGFDAVENLAAGGIDVLESIGKKTYSKLSEHDPAFKKTREYLSPKRNKPDLSSVLKEAKDEAEKEAVLAKENEEARKAHFGTLFDDYQGIAHLEALEMLSTQSEKKVHSLLNSFSSEDLIEIKPTLVAIKEAFEVDEDDESDADKTEDFSCLVNQYVSELQLGTAPDKLNKVHDMVKQWIADFDSHETHESESLKEVHQKSIQALAELTSKGVEQFHKAGEMVLLEKDTDKDCTERAHSLARLTGVLCHEVGNLAAKFAECLNKMSDKDGNSEEVTPLVTNVYLEATNSSTYIQDAFQLLLPVLQHAAIEHSIVSRQS